MDNAGQLGREHIPPISANILGDSGLNIIRGEITVSHVRKGVGGRLHELEYSKIHSVTVGVQLNGFPRIPNLRSD